MNPEELVGKRVRWQWKGHETGVVTSVQDDLATVEFPSTKRGCGAEKLLNAPVKSPLAQFEDSDR